MPLVHGGVGIPRHVLRPPKVQARARAASNFRLHGMQAPLQTQAMLKVDNRNAAPRSGPRGGRNHAWKRGEVVAGRRESVPTSCVGMMAVSVLPLFDICRVPLFDVSTVPWSVRLSYLWINKIIDG